MTEILNHLSATFGDDKEDILIKYFRTKASTNKIIYENVRSRAIDLTHWQGREWLREISSQEIDPVIDIGVVVGGSPKSIIRSKTFIQSVLRVHW